ncbi:casein kinase 1, alpha [Pancytospora philotis]|nr:casein kinase 1, alpha [Pancytospora philotis]
MDRFVLDSKIGEGSYGVVYKIINGRAVYALKVEKNKESLRNEICVLLMLSHPHIPRLVDYGLLDDFSYLVIPLFRVSLAQIALHNPAFFTFASISAVGVTLLRTLRYIHAKELVYRDLKPENIMVGFDQKIYLVDFGTAAPYSCRGAHIEEKKDVMFVGTMRYASVNAHGGWCQSRRDDLESLGYVLVFLLRQSLPWYRADGENEKDVALVKRDTTPEQLSSGLNGSAHWTAYFKHAQGLGFTEAPDYELLERCLEKTAEPEVRAVVVSPTKPSSRAFAKWLGRVFCCQR